jgi:hypothetical protein
MIRPPHPERFLQGESATTPGSPETPDAVEEVEVPWAAVVMGKLQ